MRFTLRQLQAFTVVARTKHFGKAAEVLGLSQPTVSGDIRALERALKTDLFIRSRSGTMLTKAGLDLLPPAHNVLEAAEGFHRAAALAASKPGIVRLAATPSLVNRLVPAVLHEFEANDEGPAIEVVEVPTGGVPKALAADLADVGIGHFVGRPAGTKGATIGMDGVYILAARGMLDGNVTVRLTDLRGLKLLIWPREQNPEYFDFLIEACQRRGLMPDIVESATRFSGSYSYLLTSGEAFSLVPADYARESPQSLSYTPLDPTLNLPLQAAWKAPAARGIERLLSVLRELRRSGAG